MEEKKLLKGSECEIDHVGVVVKNLDNTIGFLTALGLGPFSIHTSYHPAATVRGKKAHYRVKVAMAQQGPVQLELIEYLGGDTIHREFLEQKGEGLHHIRLKVSDIDSTLNKFAQMGIGVLQQDKFVGGGGLAYLDTAKIGGIIIELVQLPLDYDPKKGVAYQSS